MLAAAFGPLAHRGLLDFTTDIKESEYATT
jgi:hypothetical protein